MAAPTLVDDLYDRLGVGPSATDDEIAAAFRARAKEIHPDLHPDDAGVAEAFKALTHAYTVLSDAEARRRYDDRRRRSPGDARPSPEPSPHAHQPVFRTPRSARVGLWSGVALTVAGIVSGVVLAAVPTGDDAKTITLWIVVAKLLICGVILAAAAGWRLHHLRAADALRPARQPTDR
jgi:hypothetical protein